MNTTVENTTVEIAFVEVKNALARYIADAMYMEVEEIDADQLFSSYGLESITLVKIVGKIAEQFGRPIEPREVLPHQTLNEASAFIFEKISA